MNKERLLKLAEHLESGELGHDRFDFSEYHISDPHCGTAGCALGEMPFIWPDTWFIDGPAPALIGGKGIWLLESDAAEFFGIEYFEVCQLFHYHEERPWCEGRLLTPKATKEQVAESIRQFVAWKETQEAH